MGGNIKVACILLFVATGLFCGWNYDPKATAGMCFLFACIGFLVSILVYVMLESMGDSLMGARNIWGNYVRIKRDEYKRGRN